MSEVVGVYGPTGIRICTLPVRLKLVSDDARLIAFVLRCLKPYRILRLDWPAYRWLDVLRGSIDPHVDARLLFFQRESAAEIMAGAGLGLSTVLRCAPAFVLAIHSVPGEEDTLTGLEEHFFVDRTASQTCIRARAGVPQPPSVDVEAELASITLTWASLGSAPVWE